MFKHYLMMTVRSFKRDRHLSVINILGLSVALAATILIGLFIRDELSYDDWGPNGDQLYRIEGSLKFPESEREYIAYSPGRLRDPMMKDFQNDFAALSRVYNDTLVIKNDAGVFIDDISFVDPGFFEIFDLPLSSGVREAALNDNQSVLLTEATARKYFGNENPIGQTIAPENEDYAFRVVGVLKDLPEHTHLDLAMIGLFDPNRYLDAKPIATYWMSNNVYTYVKLKDGVRPDRIEAAFPDFLDRNVIMSEAPSLTGPLSDVVKLRMMPVSDIHLKSTGRFQMKQGGDMRLVISFAIIAALILFIACVNFINLAAARASKRAREVALRKVVGAHGLQLMNQFMVETISTILIALIIAGTIVELVLPIFNEFISKILNLNLIDDPVALLMMSGLLIVVALGAGLQPAFQITRVRPSEVLHSSNSARTAGSKIRALLVTIQFAISIGLIIITLVVNAQTSYSRNKDLGFTTENRFALYNLGYSEVEPVADVIRQEVEALPGVVKTAMSYRALPLGGQWGIPIQKAGDTSGKTYTLENVFLDFEMLEFLDAKLIAGRLFDRDRALDKRHQSATDPDLRVSHQVITRYASKYLGYESPEAAVGQSIDYIEDGSRQQVIIIGVVEDMLMRSLRDNLEPINFIIPEGAQDTLNIEIRPGMEEETRTAIETIWKRHVQVLPMFYDSLNELYQDLYADDKQRGEIFAGFAFFAIFVSAIGLFSQAAFSVQQRTKEISIRKVMGASNRSVLKLMLWQYSRPVLIANLIAWPIAWYLTSDWLSGFAHRIDLTVLPFIGAAAITLVIALLTVSVHAMKVAATSPAFVLRSE
jgi:putative ABC transport system permease protein